MCRSRANAVDFLLTSFPRIGRTARAGQQGTATTLYDDERADLVEALKEAVDGGHASAPAAATAAGVAAAMACRHTIATLLSHHCHTAVTPLPHLFSRTRYTPVTHPLHTHCNSRSPLLAHPLHTRYAPVTHPLQQSITSSRASAPSASISSATVRPRRSAGRKSPSRARGRPSDDATRVSFRLAAGRAVHPGCTTSCSSCQPFNTRWQRR